MAIDPVDFLSPRLDATIIAIRHTTPRLGTASSLPSAVLRRGQGYSEVDHNETGFRTFHRGFSFSVCLRFFIVFF